MNRGFRVLWLLPLLASALFGTDPAQAAVDPSTAALNKAGIRLLQTPARWTQADLDAMAQALQDLPSAYRHMGKPITLAKDLTPGKIGEDKEVLGTFSGGSTFEITLFPAPYVQWLNTAKPEVYYLALKRAFVHEMSHAIDELKGYSKSNAWKRISGWQEMSIFGIVDIMQSTSNINNKGFARAYGTVNAAEDFATYAEEFIYPVKRDNVEMTLPCRTPSKFRFFRAMFPDHPVEADPGCAPLASWIDPEKVIGIEVIFAAPSAIHPASMAGHLLLRIKLQRDIPLSSENPDDLVIAFTADINEKNSKGTSMIWGGIVGKFPSAIEEMKLSDAVIRYAEFENRDLQRFELNVSDPDRRRILERLFELKKNFTYSYKFFTDNCAAMLVQQLGVALRQDDLAKISTMPFMTPQILLARMAQRNLLTPVTPSFYGLSRRAAVAEHQIEEIHATLNGSGIPSLDEIDHKDEKVRSAAYKKMASIARQKPQYAEGIYRILVLSMDRERSREFKPFKGVIPGPAHGALRSALYETRTEPSLKPRASAVASRETTEALYAEEELRGQMLGSAHTGVMPIIVSPAYTIVAKEGHFELEIDSSMFRQLMGDVSRFSMYRSLELDLLPSKMVLSLDDASVTRWYQALIVLRQLPQQLSHEGTQVKSIFQGAGIGAGLKILEFSGDKWRGKKVEAKWLTPQIIGNIVASEGFRSYLIMSLGLEFGTAWMHDNAPNTATRGFVGLPLGIEGQLSFDGDQHTLLRIAASIDPRFNTQWDFEKEIQARITLSQYIGEFFGIEFRAHGAAEYESDPDTYRFILGVEGRPY